MLCALCREHEGVVQFTVNHDYIFWVCQLCFYEHFGYGEDETPTFSIQEDS